MKVLPLDYLVFNEIKIDETFLAAQVIIEGYRIRARGDGNYQNFFKELLNAKGNASIKNICSEFTVANDYGSALVDKNHLHEVI